MTAVSSGVTVVVTAEAGHPVDACLAAPGMQGLDSIALLVAGDDSARMAARAARAQFIPVGRPGRATARNAGLASIDTEQIAFVDGRSRPRKGWLDRLRETADKPLSTEDGRAPAARPLAAVLGRANCRGTGVHTRTVTLNGITGPPASPFGVGLFDRRSVIEVGGFSPLVRLWDDLYIIARLLGSGHPVGYADDAVVDVAPPPSRYAGAAFAALSGYWLEDLRRAADRHGRALRQVRRTAAAPRSAALTAGRLARASWAPGSRRRQLAVRSRFPATTPEVVYLTIDDGPSANTPALLRILRQHRAAATFFLIGDAARAHPEQLRDIVREGHAIGGHSLTHRRFDMLSEAEMHAELAGTQRLLATVSPAGPIRVRLPFGAGADDPYVHEAVSRWRSDCEFVQWSHDTEDHKYWPHCHSVADTDRLAGVAAERILAAPDLAGSIVLMHDTAYGGTAAQPNRFAQTLLRRLLTGMAGLGLRSAALPG